MKVIDTHCDALLKLWENNARISFQDSTHIQTNYHRLKMGEVFVQCFAIFVEPYIKSDQKFQVVLEQIELFYEQIIHKQAAMIPIRQWEQLDHLKPGEIGAILTLEGADAIGNDLTKLKALYKLGVKSVGLTWNEANLCADGVGEKRGAGLTEFGREVVQANNEHLIWTDVSHLSERSFWDVLACATYPIASHSNAYELCPHPRNLTNHQAEALFNAGGYIGVVFYPTFLKADGTATLLDIVKHIDHFCSLGGVRDICFGSDFDGISSTVANVNDASMYQNLINELLKHFKEDEVKGFAYQNFYNHRPKGATKAKS